TSRAASCPCSSVRSAPTLPATGDAASILAGPCPDTYSRLPTCTAVLYLATGLGAEGRVIPSSLRRASALAIAGLLLLGKPRNTRKDTEKMATGGISERPGADKRRQKKIEITGRQEGGTEFLPLRDLDQEQRRTTCFGLSFGHGQKGLRY